MSKFRTYPGQIIDCDCDPQDVEITRTEPDVFMILEAANGLRPLEDVDPWVWAEFNRYRDFVTDPPDLGSKGLFDSIVRAKKKASAILGFTIDDNGRLGAVHG